MIWIKFLTWLFKNYRQKRKGFLLRDLDEDLVQKDSIDERDYVYSGLDKDLPISAELRVPSHVQGKNQGRIGSCASHAFMSAFEIMNPGHAMSELYHYYKSRELAGTLPNDSGMTLRDGAKSFRKFGSCIEFFWSYDPYEVNTKPNNMADKCAKMFRINSYYRVLRGDVEAVKSLIADGVPVIGGWQLFKSFYYYTPNSYENGVYVKESMAQVGGRHAMCCHPQTIIKTKEGLTSIDLIQKNDEVLTRKGYKKVKEVMNRKVNEEIYNIYTQLSIYPLKVTKEHPILVRKCSKITKFNYLDMSKFCFENAENLKEGWFVKSKIDKNIEKNNISKDFARLLGYYIGDGNISLKYSKNGNIKSGKLRLTYHRNDKKEIVKDMIDIIKEIDPEINYNIYKYKKSNCNSIEFYSTALAKKILNLCGGANNKDCNKLLFIEPEKQLEFIKGWFKTDGCGKWLETSNIFTSEKNLAEQLIFILQRNKLCYYCNVRKPYINFIKGKNCNCKGGFKIYFHKQKSKDRLYYQNDYILSRINKINKENYDGVVYNFEVEDCHEYEANNLIVHNCIIGFDDERKAFKLLNSWGRNWGDNGTCWVSYKFFRDYCFDAWIIQ